jgi:hypothetical protein
MLHVLVRELTGTGGTLLCLAYLHFIELSLHHRLLGDLMDTRKYYEILLLSSFPSFRFGFGFVSQQLQLLRWDGERKREWN